MTKKSPGLRKPLRWMGSSNRNLLAFPLEVRRAMGVGLRHAQSGRTSLSAKPLTGDPAFAGTSAMELVEDFSGDTYRVVYHVEPYAVYVLDAFIKKSKTGIATPLRDIRRIKSRLKAALEDYAKRHRSDSG